MAVTVKEVASCYGSLRRCPCSTADPLFVGERTLVFEVESIAALEEEGRGILLERTGTERTGAHAALLLEARFDVSTFTARIMLDAARRIPSFKPGAHRYSL